MLLLLLRDRGYGLVAADGMLAESNETSENDYGLSGAGAGPAARLAQ